MNIDGYFQLVGGVAFIALASWALLRPEQREPGVTWRFPHAGDDDHGALWVSEPVTPTPVKPSPDEVLTWRAEWCEGPAGQPSPADEALERAMDQFNQRWGGSQMRLHATGPGVRWFKVAPWEDPDEVYRWHSLAELIP